MSGPWRREQTLLYKFLSLSGEFGSFQSQNAQLQSSLDERLAELAQAQAQKHQLHLQSIGKDGEIERLKTEASELHKSKRQLLEMIEQKDLEISEKNATIESYLDKIVNLSDTAAQKEARLSEIEAELVRAQASCTCLSQDGFCFQFPCEFLGFLAVHQSACHLLCFLFQAGASQGHISAVPLLIPPVTRVFERGGVKLVVDDILYDFVKGATVDYVEEASRMISLGDGWQLQIHVPF
ncbi:hypothetical protein SLA2020_444550 [Shorea laevis]